MSRYDETDERLDDIYDVVDELFLAGEFRKVDTLLYAMKNCDDFDIQLGLLTITIPAKSKLNNRQAIFDCARDYCITNERDLRVLDGLE